MIRRATLSVKYFGKKQWQMKILSFMLLVLTLPACSNNGSGGNSVQTQPAARKMASLGSEASLSSESTVRSVYMSAGLVQCEEDSGLGVAEVRGRLISAGIDVLSQNCAERTDVAYAMVCGGKTGHVFIFQIRNENLPDAEELDFIMLEEIESYTLYDCDI